MLSRFLLVLCVCTLFRVEAGDTCQWTSTGWVLDVNTHELSRPSQTVINNMCNHHVTKKRRLLDGSHSWCGVLANECDDLKEIEFQKDAHHTCEDMTNLFETMGKHVCCGLNTNAHTAAYEFVGFFKKFPYLFEKTRARNLDLECGTHFEDLASHRPSVFKHMSDYETAPEVSCVHVDDTGAVDDQDQFTFYVLQHGERGVHLTGVLAVGDIVLETISWAMDSGATGFLTPSTFHVLGDAVGFHMHPAGISERPVLGLKFHFPAEIFTKVVRANKMAGERWDLFKESCSSAVYKVIQRAFELTEVGDCFLGELPLFYFPDRVFKVLLKAAELSGRGRLLDVNELEQLIEQGLNFHHWKNTLN